jgi:hypothetical protein
MTKILSNVRQIFNTCQAAPILVVIINDCHSIESSHILFLKKSFVNWV